MHRCFRSFKCGIQDSFVSSVIPNNFVVVTWGIGCDPIFTVSGGKTPLIFVKCIITVLVGVKLNPFLTAHLYTSLVASCILLSADSKLADLVNMAKSST